MSDIFEGFESSNTTAVPDVLFDELLSQLSGAEIKVLLYIIRRTAGFKKTTDAISLTQFEKGIITHEGKVLDKGCGLNRETICKALQSLEKRGCIKTEKRTAKKRDKDTTLYSIRFKGDAQVVGKSDHVGSRNNELPDVVGKSDYRSRKTSKMVVGKSDLQDTVIQDTDSQTDTGVATASTDVSENNSHSLTPNTNQMPLLIADNASEKPNGNNTTPSKKKVLPPIMPPDDVPWDAETLVQVLEARQERRFPNGAKKAINRIRDKALTDAQTLIDMGDVDRIGFTLAVHRLETRRNNWWLDNVGHVQPYHLIDKDRIHTMMDELKRQYGPSWREKLMNKTTSPNAPTETRKSSGPLAGLPPSPKSNAELRMEAV